MKMFNKMRRDLMIRALIDLYSSLNGYTSESCLWDEEMSRLNALSDDDLKEEYICELRCGDVEL